MNADAVLAILRNNERDLRARGVRRAALFGSVARGDNRPGSDIDIMIEVESDADIGVFEYVAIKEHTARGIQLCGTSARCPCSDLDRQPRIARPRMEERPLGSFCKGGLQCQQRAQWVLVQLWGKRKAVP